MSITITFARITRTTRVRLRLTQQHVAEVVGVSRGHIAKIEAGRANPSIGLVERIAAALDLQVELIARTPTIVGATGQRDFVHARCLGYVDDRLRNAGWATAREVEIVHAHSHGWIDLVAFDLKSGTLVIIEVKTRLDDLGAVERQVGWYERSAHDVAQRLGWRSRRVASWLLILASEEVEATLRANRASMARAFPARARDMSALTTGADTLIPRRGVALIDPQSRRRAWLIPSRIDGRRSKSPYSTYADAARRLAR